MPKFIVHGFCDDSLGSLTYWGYMLIDAKDESEANDEYTDGVNAWVEDMDFQYQGDMPVTQTASQIVEDGKVKGKTFDESTLHMLTYSWGGVYIRCQPTGCTVFKEEDLQDD